MFAKATSKFVSEIDPEGCLIPVSRLNETDNLKPLSLVIKHKRFWFWQYPKYVPLDFTLNDVLVGQSPIKPEVTETDFLKYKSTSENVSSGGAEAGIGPGKINIEGKGSSKLAYSFGNLKKQEVDVQELLNLCKDRVMDLQHSLVQQVREKKREVFTLVKERIITTQPCNITEVVQEGGTCGAFLGLTIPKQIQVSVKNGSHQSDSNISLEIPAETALAYCLIELNVKSNGQFDLCLLPGTAGGFETETVEKITVTKVASTPPGTLNKQLQNDLDELHVQFKLLSELPASTRSSLFQQLTLLLKDKAAIIILDQTLEDLCSGKKPDPENLDKIPSSKAAVQTTLELLQGSEGAVSTLPERTEEQPSPLTAAHALCSALEELTDSELSGLESCCRSSTIQALNALVQNMGENRKSCLTDSRLAVLAEEDTFNSVKELFASCNIILCKQEDSICAEISNQKNHIPLILCIAICGLASLAPPV